MTPRTKSALWIVVAGLIIAAVFFAPLFGAGICVDAEDSANSYCREWQTSLMGLETTPWLWIGTSILVGLIGLVVAWPRRAPRAEAA